MKQHLQVAVLLAAIFCLFTVGGFFIEATKAVGDSRVLIAETQKRLVYTDQNVNAMLVQLGLVADNVRRATDAQKEATAKELQILQHTDDLLTQTQANVALLTSHTTATIDSFQVPLARMDQTLQDLNKVVADGNITQTLANVQETSKQTAIAAAHIAQTSDDVRKVADHYEATLTHPVSIVKNIFKGALVGLRAYFLLK